jgi:hypothetical protein
LARVTQGKPWAKLSGPSGRAETFKALAMGGRSGLKLRGNRLLRMRISTCQAMGAKIAQRIRSRVRTANPSIP